MMAKLHHAALLCAALVWLCSCGTGEPATGGTLPGISELDNLARGTSDLSTVTGANFLLSSGAPAATIHPSQATWLVLDGDQTGSSAPAWAVWQLSLAPTDTLQSVTVNMQQIGLRRYWLAYADFTAQRWSFVQPSDLSPLGKSGASTVLSTELESMVSPAGNIYVAVLVLGGQSPSSKINVEYVEAAYSTTGIDPIADAYEDNDTLDSCATITPGLIHASIHQTPRDDMSDPQEETDPRDIYCIDVPSGHELTVTLRYNVFNHFGSGVENELDLLYYATGAEDEYNDFVESESSFNLFFYPFEHIHVASATGIRKVGVIAEILDGGIEDDAEYDMYVFVSDETHTVSGTLKQSNMDVTHKFAVFLEPGNFNDITWFPGDEGPAESKGDFVIEGVPDGSYTLKVHGSGGYEQPGWVYTTTIPIVVSGGDVQNADINIEPYSGP
jgi:hypothetical protein